MKTYGDVLREYGYHPESKYAAANGNQCGKQAIGLLQRRHVQIDHIKFIGKESNELENVGAGLIHKDKGVYTEYPNQNYDEWEMRILPTLERIPLSVLVRKTGMSRIALKEIRAGRSRPHRSNQELLIGFFNA